MYDMNGIIKLQPEKVFLYFDEICRIPRASKKEEKIMEYLLQFAGRHNLPAKQDAAGNVLISKSASKGMENKPVVVLQSHVDMVCEKNRDTVHDFDTDPIVPYVDGDWVRAKGTTLGADCGIGIAASLALLADRELKHGAIECLFTVDEETGLTGAKNIESGFFTGKIMLNLDSEDDGELFIGCAGGIDTQALFTYTKESAPSNHTAFKASVTGLLGGHSGDDINKERGNSIKILTRFLRMAADKYGVRLSKYEGGNLRNAIPREAYAVFVVKSNSAEKLKNDFDLFSKDILNEYKTTEPNLKLSLEQTGLPEYLIDESTQFELLCGLHCCPSGVLNMSMEISGLVETSTNLASVKFVNSNQILVGTSQRSSVESRKNDASDMVKSVFKLTNATVSVGEGYPGWQPNLDSRVLKVTREAYIKLFGAEPAVKAIHAGLECGLFSEKYPGLDMISFGPTIRGAHSPDERLEIATVDKFWKLILETLANI
jgi:dipeptidase D